MSINFTPEKELITYKSKEYGYSVSFTPITDDKKLLIFAAASSEAALMRCSSEILGDHIFSATGVNDDAGKPIDFKKIDRTFKTFFIDDRIKEDVEFAEFAYNFVNFSDKKKLLSSILSYRNSGNLDSAKPV